MLDMPILEDKEILHYYLCIDCLPYVRIVKHCKWRKPKNICKPNSLVIERTALWCEKMDAECNVESCPTTGYVFCPQIREWQEKQADWVKGQNADFEKDKCASCPDKDKCKVNPRQKELEEKVEGDLY